MYENLLCQGLKPDPRSLTKVLSILTIQGYRFQNKSDISV